MVSYCYPPFEHFGNGASSLEQLSPPHNGALLTTFLFLEYAYGANGIIDIICHHIFSFFLCGAGYISYNTILYIKQVVGGRYHGYHKNYSYIANDVLIPKDPVGASTIFYILTNTIQWFAWGKYTVLSFATTNYEWSR